MKKTTTIILTVMLPLLLIGGGVWAYFGALSPNASARRTADTVMQAATSQQQDAFAKHGEPSGSRDFYALSAQRNYRFESQSSDGATMYVLYVFTDENSPSRARIGIENGTVTTLATGNKLAATPAGDGKETTATTSTTSHCLSKNDLAYLDSTDLYAKTFRGATMIFDDDTSTTYAGEDNGAKLLDRMASFYDKTSTKDYSFLVRGYLAAKKETLEARKQVIQNRTTKLQQELVDRDIPEDRVSIGEPIAYPIDQPTNSQNERYVIIDIVNNCSK